MVKDRVGDRPVSVESADQNRALLRVVLDDRQIVALELGRVQHAVWPRELADLVQQAGGAHDVALVLVAAELRRKRGRIGRDGGRVATGRLVAHAERANERAQNAELQAHELARARLEMLGALLGAQQRDRQALEDEQHDDRGDEQWQPVLLRRRRPESSPARPRRARREAEARIRAAGA